MTGDINQNVWRRWLPGLVSVAVWASVLVGSSPGQLPRTVLTTVFPPGGRVGQTVEIELGGANLDGVHQIVCSHSGIVGQPVMREPGEFETGQQPVPNRFRVAIAADVPTGRYEVRALGRFGLSNPRVFVVGPGDEVVEQGDHGQADKSLTLAVGQTANGRLDAAQIDWYQVALAENQTATFRCVAAEIDSDARPIMTVYDPAGHQLARTTDLRESKAVVQATAAGNYRVSLHDHTFSGGAQHVYRLSVTDGVVPDVIYPPMLSESGEPGSELVGIARASRVQGRKAPAAAIWRPDAAAAKEAHWWLTEAPINSAGALGSVADALADPPARWLHQPNWVQPLPLWKLRAGEQLTVETLDEVESLRGLRRGTESIVSTAVPATVVGRFFPHGDVDWWEFDGRQGDEYWIEVYSHRLGAPSAPRLMVQRAEPPAADAQPDAAPKWSSLAVVEQYLVGGDRNEARPVDPNARDPRYRLQIDRDGRYRVGLYDLYCESRDDPAAVYRVEIRRPNPHVRLTAWVADPNTGNDRQFDLDAPVLRPGETMVVHLIADRVDGYDGPITLSLVGLPEHVRTTPLTLSAGKYFGQLLIQASPDAAPWHGSVQVVGHYPPPAAASTTPAAATAASEVSSDGSLNCTATVVTLSGSSPDLGRNKPASRLASSLWLSVLGNERMPVVVQTGQVPDATSPAESVWQTAPGGRLTIPVKVGRTELFPGPAELAVAGVVDGLQADPVKVAEKAEQAELVVQVKKPDLPPGDYQLYLQGKVPFKYSRNLQAIEAQTAEKARADQLVEQLKQAVAAAEANGTLAAEALAKEKEKLTRAEAFAKQATDRLEQIRKENEPKDVTAWVRSPTIDVRIHQSPVHTVLAGPATGQGGGAVETTWQIERRFGFAGPVKLQFQAAEGQPAFTADAVEVPADQTSAVCRIQIPAGTPAGKYTGKLNVLAKFNDVDTSATQTVEIQVTEPVAAQ